MAKKAIDLKSAVLLINDSEEDSVPKELYENPDLYLALIEGDDPYTGMSWLVDNYMPDALKADRNLMLKLIKQNGQVFERVGAPLRDDKELVSIALESDIELFEYAGSKIKSDKTIVNDFLKRWLKEKPGSVLPLLWISKDLTKDAKFVELANVKSFPTKPGYNRFVIDIYQDEVTEKNADAVLAKHTSFIEAIVKDKKAVLFEEIIQKDQSEDMEQVETFACLYIKDLTLEDMDNYLNNLAGKKIRAASATIYDVDNPCYMNYMDAEVSSGSIDSEEFETGDDVVKQFEKRNLNTWPIKILDNY
jgi:hypothetical protein